MLATGPATEAGVQCDLPLSRSPVPERSRPLETQATEAPQRARRQFSAAQRPKAPEVAPASGYLPFRGRHDRHSARNSARSKQPAVHPYTLAANVNRTLDASAKTRESSMPGLIQPSLSSKAKGGLSAMPSLARRSGPSCSAAAKETPGRDPFTDPGSVSFPSRPGDWDSDASDSADSLQGGRCVKSERQHKKRATFRHDVVEQKKSDGDTPSPPVRKLGAHH